MTVQDVYIRLTKMKNFLFIIKGQYIILGSGGYEKSNIKQEKLFEEYLKEFQKVDETYKNFKKLTEDDVIHLRNVLEEIETNCYSGYNEENNILIKNYLQSLSTNDINDLSSQLENRDVAYNFAYKYKGLIF